MRRQHYGAPLKEGGSQMPGVENVASVLERDSRITIERWLSRVLLTPQLTDLLLLDQQRCAHLAEFIREIVARLRKVRILEAIAIPSPAAVRHGQTRYRQGYSAPMIVHESRILQVCLFETIQRNLASLDFNMVLPEVMLIADEVDSQLTQCIDSFLKSTGRSIRLRDAARNAGFRDDIVGTSPLLKQVLDLAVIVAGTDSTVLLTGETGTGKGRLAQMIHGMSQRSERNLMTINCAAIPTGLLESELFGHEKGAFTGAVSAKKGRLELADQGTLLLDEIGDIPLEIQPKLLRVLQDQEFERLGSTKTLRVDVRIIAATNLDLIQAVDEKEFRADLFYRLNVFPLHMPALRDRAQDIPLLVGYLVEKYTARHERNIASIPSEAMQAMVSWRWPGNIRELENFIERSVILSKGDRLNAPIDELQDGLAPQSTQAGTTLLEKEREHIVNILRDTRGTLSGVAGAAARLGLKRTTLQYKMQRMAINRQDYAN
jgi:formate hydrogenlyase transcriptional activator